MTTDLDGPAHLVLAAFTFDHMKVMLRHQIVQAMIALELDPDEVTVAVIAHRLGVDARPGLDDAGQPCLVWGEPDREWPMATAIDGQLRKLLPSSPR